MLSLCSPIRICKEDTVTSKTQGSFENTIILVHKIAEYKNTLAAEPEAGCNRKMGALTDSWADSIEDWSVCAKMEFTLYNSNAQSSPEPNSPHALDW